MAQLLWTAKTEKTVPTSQRQRVCVFGLPFRSRVVGRLSENSTFPGFDSLRDGANIEIPSRDRLTASVAAGSAPLQLRRHERQLGNKGSLIVNVGLRSAIATPLVNASFVVGHLSLVVPTRAG